MIPVPPQQEYAEFDIQVRQPGARFLADNPNPTSKDFKSKNFWSRASKPLHHAYSGICAYTAMYIMDGSVDHYLPKVGNPLEAYEWRNFRLANPKVNNSKGDSIGVIDPFVVGDDWFRIDLPSCLIVPHPTLAKAVRISVNSTINILGLNREDTFVDERSDILQTYGRDEVSLDFLERRYPFLAREVVRHGGRDRIREVFKL